MNASLQPAIGAAAPVPARRHGLRAFAGPLVALAVYVAVAASAEAWVWLAGRIFPSETRLIYDQAAPLALVWQQLSMVLVSSVMSVAIGLSLAVFVTHRAGRDFHDVVAGLGNLAQTFPPIAVFTLAVPLLGFGFKPTVLALTLYGILPVLQNTIAGIESVSPAAVESARGMGMTPLQLLWRVELPLAAGVIMAGVRISVVVNVATATIGAVAGAGGLGAPIISGLIGDDPAVTLHGAMLAAGMALLADAFLGTVERELLARQVTEE